MSQAEADLVQSAKAGDCGAFEEIVRRTSRLVFSRLYLDTGDTHQAEDLLQETLLRAFRSLAELHDPKQLRAWLLAIAQNVTVDDARRQARQKRVAPTTPHTRTGVPGPSDNAVQAETRAQVLAVLRALPEEYRLPLTLRYIAGADYATIEIQLGLTNGALRGLLHRGLKMLREKMGEENRL